LRRAGKITARFFSVLIAMLLVIVVALCAAMWVLASGPSPTAQRLFVMTVRETSAMGFLANMYLSDNEIERIMTPAEPEGEFIEATDPSLITVQAVMPIQPAGNAELPVVIDDDGDFADIELHEVTGNGYRGYMMIVRDPKRLFVGTPNNFGGRGLTLMEMVTNTGAVAGINAGGFYDPAGSGRGGIPDGLVICDGVLLWGSSASRVNVIGFDADGILHVGTMTPTAAINLGLQWAVSFGPTLISNGVPQTQRAIYSGINPRTAIGQRADSAVLLLVVDGRQIDSLGATLVDLIEIFLDFGAVNAANLDGGSSTLMMLDGEVVNRSASVVGPRPLPTTFLVR
jgi:exopolysaccharide biosynthesis protein